MTTMLRSDLIERVARRYVEAVYRPRGPAKAWETRQENDSLTKHNIPDEYHLLWEKVKRQFKGKPDSRYEQFMEWMEENPDANLHIQMEQADKEMRQWERKEHKEMLCQQRCPSCYTRQQHGDDLSNVPF